MILKENIENKMHYYSNHKQIILYGSTSKCLSNFWVTFPKLKNLHLFIGHTTEFKFHAQRTHWTNAGFFLHIGFLIFQFEFGKYREGL